jgi:hypothetical protein
MPIVILRFVAMVQTVTFFVRVALAFPAPIKIIKPKKSLLYFLCFGWP